MRAPAATWEDVDDGIEGLLEEWYVAVGDVVEAGQAIASLMIVKASLDLEAPLAGTVVNIIVAKGETFGRDTELARIQPSI